MSNDTMTAPELPVEENLKRAVHSYSIWSHTIPAHVDWRVALLPSYWIGGRNIEKLAAGDRIDVITADREVAFELLVQEVLALGGYIKLAARPLFPADLQLPDALEALPQPRYIVRPHIDGLFQVVDTVTGSQVKAQLYKGAAAQLAYEKNQADVAAKMAADRDAARADARKQRTARDDFMEQEEEKARDQAAGRAGVQRSAEDLARMGAAR